MPALLSEIHGDLLQIETEYIAHQCNCVTTHGRGLSETLFTRFPWADTYTDRQKVSAPGTIQIFGDGQRQRYVINLYAQYNPGKPRSPHDTAPIRERWFADCLDQIAVRPALHEVAFPFGIGCGLAGGDWEHYHRLLENFAQKNPAIRVILVKKQGREGR